MPTHLWSLHNIIPAYTYTYLTHMVGKYVTFAYAIHTYLYLYILHNTT